MGFSRQEYWSGLPVQASGIPLFFYDPANVGNEERNEPTCFYGRFKSATLKPQQWVYTSFAIRPQFPGS